MHRIQHEGLERAAGPCQADGSESDNSRDRRWFQNLAADNHGQIRFLGDPTGAFTKKLDLDFDSLTAIFGNARSKRYVLKVEDGKVSEAHVEPDNTGYTSK